MIASKRGLFRANASSTPRWQDVNWHVVYRKVRQLQVRIVKATQAGKWRKVERLQRLLTHSMSAKLLAVRRVTENQGKKTPGVDGETWSTPVQKIQAALNLSKKGYKPKPLRRIYIPKAEPGKLRPLSIPTMKDRAMQTVYQLALDPVAETLADPNSYGFRRGRSPHDAIEQVHNVLSGKHAAKWVLKADIKGCFDHLGHQWLVSNIPTDTTMLRKWLKAGYLEGGTLHPTEEGSPQGGCISPTLANRTLDGLEDLLRDHFTRENGYRSRKNPHKINVVRFADDILITGASREVLEEEVKPIISAFLKERGLQLNEQKSKIIHVDEGFDFLGFTVRSFREKTIIKPSAEAVKRFKAKIAETLARMKTAKATSVIGRLNPIITGWGNYYRHAVSKVIFSQLDTWIWQKLWTWSKRRHPHKPRRWIAAKYFAIHRGWMFFGEERKGRIHIRMLRAIPIKRHIKIRSAANPYDPAWEPYFESRLDKKWADHPDQTRKLRSLYRDQEGQCPVCGEKITRETGWNVHHVIERCKGGPDTLENLIVLHPTCHRQVHSLGLPVSKPEGSGCSFIKA